MHPIFNHLFMDGLGLGAGIMGTLGGTEVAKLISDNILSNNFSIFSTVSGFDTQSLSVSGFNLFYLRVIFNNDKCLEYITPAQRIYVYRTTVNNGSSNTTYTISWDGSSIEGTRSLILLQTWLLVGIQ